MAILNKKSMLFLLATILLVCSSYADDHLSSAGREERVLINAGSIRKYFENINMVKAIHRAKQYQDIVQESAEQIKKYKEKEEKNKKEKEKVYALFNKICTDVYHCKPSDKCNGALCAYRFVYKKTLDCKTECGGKG